MYEITLYIRLFTSNIEIQVYLINNKPAVIAEIWLIARRDSSVSNNTFFSLNLSIGCNYRIVNQLFAILIETYVNQGFLA
jgi:hypothetical protein